MAKDLWGRLVSLSNLRVLGATTIGQRTKPVAGGNGLGQLHSRLSWGGPQSFFPGGTPADSKGASEMSTTNPVAVAALQAAAPVLLTLVNTVEQFEADLGPDPLKWPVMLPGAKMKLVGNLMLQIPVLATAEAGAVENAVNTQLNSWKTKLLALSAPPVPLAPVPPVPVA